MRRAAVALIAFGYAVLAACGGGIGGVGAGAGPATGPAASEAFVLDVAWPPNPDDPDGYLVYIGRTADSANTLVASIFRGQPNWNPTSPSVRVGASDVARTLGSVSQVCVAIRAYNAGGVSPPSDPTCAAVN